MQKVGWLTPKQIWSCVYIGNRKQGVRAATGKCRVATGSLKAILGLLNFNSDVILTRRAATKAWVAPRSHVAGNFDFIWNTSSRRDIWRGRAAILYFSPGCCHFFCFGLGLSFLLSFLSWLYLFSLFLGLSFLDFLGPIFQLIYFFTFLACKIEKQR